MTWVSRGRQDRGSSGAVGWVAWSWLDLGVTWHPITSKR